MSSTIGYIPFASNEIHSKQMENSYLRNQIAELTERNKNLSLENASYKTALNEYKEHTNYVNNILDHARQQLEQIEAEYASLKQYAETLEQELNKKQ